MQKAPVDLVFEALAPAFLAGGIFGARVDYLHVSSAELPEQTLAKAQALIDRVHEGEPDLRLRIR